MSSAISEAPTPDFHAFCLATGIRGEALARLEREDTQPDGAAPDRLVRSPVTPLPDGSATVAYAQRHANLEVWEAGIAVTMLAGPLRVVSSRSSYHHDVTLANASVLDRVPRLTAAQLASALGLRDRGGQRVRIHATRLRVYRYDVDDPNAVGKRGAPQRPGVAGPEPRLPVPPVPDTIVPGNEVHRPCARAGRSRPCVRR